MSLLLYMLFKKIKGTVTVGSLHVKCFNKQYVRIKKTEIGIEKGLAFYRFFLP